MAASESFVSTENRSSTTFWPWLLAIILSALGISTGTQWLNQKSPSTNPSTTPRTQQQTPTPARHSEHEPLAPLIDFLAINHPESSGLPENTVIDATKSDSGSTSISVRDTSPLQHPSDIRHAISATLATPRKPDWKYAIKQATRADIALDTLIAFVPDPIDSGDMTAFDATLEMIIRAAADSQSSGWLLDRQQTPWEGVLRAGEARPTRHHEEPGLLLFRHKDYLHDKQSRRLLLVFLVGETPTAGIHKSAVWKSLNLIAHIDALRRPAPKPDEPIRLLGPAYSGSAVSIAEALRAIPNKLPMLRRHSFLVISGSATAIRSTDLINNVAARGITLEYRTTQLPYDYLINDILIKRVLRDILCVPFSSIAMLEEAGTTFGEATTSAQNKEETSAQNKEGTSVPKVDYQGIYRIKFPLHISAVRTARAKVDGAIPSPYAIKTPTPGDLPVEFDDKRESADVAPLFSPKLTPVSDDLVLRSAVLKCWRDGVRYFGITATDFADTMFLAKLIREECPDARLFLAEPRYLMAHPEMVSVFRGTLVASTYPLHLSNQQWTPTVDSASRSARTQFCSSTAQATYNAVLILLDNRDVHCVLTTPRNLAEYGRPFGGVSRSAGGCVPNSWISIVGNGGIYPVYSWPTDMTKPKLPRWDLHGSYESARHVYHSGLLPSSPVNLVPPFAWIGMSWWFLILLYRAPDRAKMVYQEPSYVLVILFATMSALLWNILVLSPWYASTTMFIMITTILAFVLLTIPVVSHARCIRSLGVTRARVGISDCDSLTIGRRMILVAACAASFASAALAVAEFGKSILGTWFDTEHCELLGRLTWRTRAGSLGSGVSVIPPLNFCFVALVVWSVCFLRQKWLRRHFNMSCPLQVALVSHGPHGPHGQSILQGPRDGDEVLEFDRRLTRIFDGLASPWIDVRALAVAAIVISVGGALIWRRALWTIDGVCFDVTIWLVMCTLCVVILDQFILFRCGVTGFLAMLRLFGQLPMVHAFGRLPSGFVNSFGRYLSDTNPNSVPYHYLMRLAEQIQTKWRAQSYTYECRAFGEGSLASSDLFGTSWARTSESLGRQCHAVAVVCIQQLSIAYWPTKTLRRKDDLVESPAGSTLYSLMEDYLAAYSVVYFSSLNTILRTHAVGLTCESLCLLMAATSYALFPQAMMGALLMGWVVFVSVYIVRCLLAFERDELMSRINSTTINRVTWDGATIARIVEYVLPVAVVVLTQFGDAWGILWGWLGVLGRALD